MCFPLPFVKLVDMVPFGSLEFSELDTPKFCKIENVKAYASGGIFWQHNRTSHSTPYNFRSRLATSTG